MNKKYDVITVLDTCVDMLIDCGNTRPQFGQAEQLVREYYLELGGSCSIFACGAAKLGLHVAGIGVVGNDVYGSFVTRTLARNGVDVSYIRVDDAIKTGVGIVLCMDNHDRAILTYNGSIGQVRACDISEDLIAATRHLHIGSYYLLKQMQLHYPRIIRLAKRHGVSVSLDTNWDPEDQWENGIHELLPLIDVFLPNENEAMLITKTDNIQSALGKLSDMVPMIAMKRGAKGGMAFFEGKSYSFGSIDVDVADTVGAGDSFDAGFIYAMLQGCPVQECLRIGCICGSYNTTNIGGIRGQIHKDALNELLSGGVKSL